MAHILLTGFEPFAGDRVNASAEAVQCVAATWSGAQTLSTAILPAITPERTAFDDATQQARATMLDVDSLIAACRAVGVASEASDSAGRYVCNEVFYRLLEMLDRRIGCTGGFIHLPAVRGREGELTVEALATGLAAMARDAAGRISSYRCT